MSGSTEKTIKRRFKWIIEGVTREKLEKPGFRLKSLDPVSINFGNNQTEWGGEISFEKSGYLRIDVHKVSALHDDFDLIFTIALHDIKNVSARRESSLITLRGWDQFISFDKLFDTSLKYISNHQIELIYDLEIFYKEDDNTDVDLMGSLLKRNTAYYSDAAFTDFILKSSDGEEFKVHRMVLAYESDFFMKLFTTDMEEKHKGFVLFEDIDSVTLKEVISYIYTLETNIDDVEKASKVIDVAEKFNLAGLKAICVKKLKEKINKENAIEILAIADLYNEKKLETSCLDIILKNYAAVKRSDAWKSLTFPLLIKITDWSVSAPSGIETINSVIP